MITEFESNDQYDNNEAIKLEKEIVKPDEKINYDDNFYLGTSLGLFMKDIKKYEVLDKEREDKLIKIMCSDSKDKNREIAKQQLVLHNIRLVIYVAKRYRDLGLNFEDLIDEGIIGLMKGLDKFNYKKGYKLSTYCVWYIRQNILLAVNNNRNIRLPYHINTKLMKIYRVKKELTNKLGKEPTPGEIARKCKLTKQEVEEALSYSKNTNTTSLFNTAYTGDDGNEVMILDTIPDKGQGPEDFADKSILRDRIEQSLSCLTDKEKQIIRLRYGLTDSGMWFTLEEIGDKLGITRQRVNAIERSALKKLKDKLKDFESYVK